MARRKTHTAGKGQEALNDARFNIMEQPRRTPELNLCDESLWTAISRKLVEEEMDWEEENGDDFSETMPQFKARCERIAYAMTEDEINAMATHTRKVCRRLIEAKGSYI